MKTEPMSFRVAEETRDRWEEFKASTGKTAEEALSTLLDTHNQAQHTNITLKTPLLSGAKNTIPAVAKNLQTSLDLMVTTIFLAEQGASEVQNQAQSEVEAAQRKISELTSDAQILMTEAKEAHAKLPVLETENQDLRLRIAELREQAETVQALKSTWAARETDMLGQISELKSKATAADELGKRNHQISHELEATKSMLVQKESELTRLTKANARTEEALIAEAATRASFQAKVAELNAECRALNNQIAADERRLKEYHSMVVNFKQLAEAETLARTEAEKLYAVAQTQLQATTHSNLDTNDIKGAEITLLEAPPIDSDLPAPHPLKLPKKSHRKQFGASKPDPSK